MSEKPSQPHTYTVTAEDVGTRLQHFLGTRLKLSLSQTTRLLDRGLVQVDHWVAKRKHKGFKLNLRQVVKVENFIPPDEQRAIANPDLPIEIIASNDEVGWIVVNKPAGVPVHPLEPDEANTVLSALIAKHPHMHGIGEGSLRSGVVHRLDIETSGTLLFATKQDTWQRLRDAFTKHQTHKLYRALVLGTLSGQGSERMLLHIAQHRPALVRIIDESAPQADWPSGTRWCDLTWRVLENFNEATLIEVNLGTGFLHQIRAMFSHLGHPLAGDSHYARGDVTDRTGAERPMLHASSLKVEGIEAGCELPADFVAVCERLRGR